MSRGLGLSRQQWEQQHTESSRYGTMVEYDEGKYSVIFTDNKISRLEIAFRGVQPTLEDARIIAQPFFPTDAQHLQTYHPDGFPELTVDLYYSKFLEAEFDTKSFVGGNPGEFIAIYGVFDGRVPTIVIGLGNNP